MKPYFIIAALLLTACAQTSNTIDVGGLFGLTGISNQFGTDERMGAEMAIKEINAAGGINGKQVRFIVEDGQTSPDATLSAYRKLVDVDKVDYIIGPTWGWPAEPILPSLRQDNVILISPSAGEADNPAFNNPLFFKTYPPYKLETDVLAAHMQKHNRTKITIIASDGGFEATMYVGFTDIAAKHNITITSTHIVAGSAKDFKTVIEKVKQDKPEALYVVLGDYGAMGEFVKQAKQLSLTAPVYTYSGIENNGLLETYGLWLEGIIYPISDFDERDTAFNTRFESEYGRKPLTPSAATAYDAAMMLALALKRGEDVQTVQKELRAIENYEGASAIHGFDETGWPVTDKQYKLKTVKNKAFVELKEKN